MFYGLYGSIIYGFLYLRQGRVGSPKDLVDFQSDYLVDIALTLGTRCQVDRREMFYKWWQSFQRDPLNYRDEIFTSLVTGKRGAPMKTNFIRILDDSDFLDNY